MSVQLQNPDCDTSMELHVREEPMRSWVAAVGELDLATTDAFDRRLWEVQSHSQRVVLDLSALVFIDSAGLRSILAARLRAVTWHRRLDVVCGAGQVRRMLSVSGVDALLVIIEPCGMPQAHHAGKAAA